MNLSELPDDRLRAAPPDEPVNWGNPYIGPRAMAEYLFDLNNVPYEVLRKFTRDDCIEFADVLAKIGTDTAHEVIGWMNATDSHECETQVIRSTYVGRFGDDAQATVSQALDILTKHKAEALVRQYFPNWRAS